MRPCREVQEKAKEKSNLLNAFGTVNFCERIGNQTKIKLEQNHDNFIILDRFETHRIDVGEIVKFYCSGHTAGRDNQEYYVEAYEIFADKEIKKVKFRWLSSPIKYRFTD